MINLGFFLRFFCESGPWNGLPTALRLPELTLSGLKCQLKTHLFQHSTSAVLVAAVDVVYRRLAPLRLF